MASTGTKKLLCRACLRKAGQSAPNIFTTWNNGDSTIARDLTNLTGITVRESDEHPKVICHTCCSALHQACEFVAMVIESDLKLQSWPQPIELDKNVNGDILEVAKEPEIKQEVLSDDDHFDTNTMDDDTPDLAMDIKIEPEEITEPIPIKVTVNDAGEEIVTILEEAYDPLSCQSEKSIKPAKKGKNAKNLTPTCDGSDLTKDKYVDVSKNGNNINKSLRATPNNESFEDLLDAKNTKVKSENNDDDLPNLYNKRGRPMRKAVLKRQKIETKKSKDKEMECEAVDANPDMDLILEAENEEPLLNTIAKKIAANVKVPKTPLSVHGKKRMILKYQGKAYRTASGRLQPAKIMGPRCRCRKEVYCDQAALTEKQRKFIFDTFYSYGDRNKQWAFVIKFTTKSDKAVPYTTGIGFCPRDFSYRYYLPLTEDLDGEKVRVCRKMFSNTLASNMTVSCIWKTYEGEDFKPKRTDDKTASVCEHFRIMQRAKLKLLKQRAAGLPTERIHTFGFRKMFIAYCEWIKTSEYSVRAQNMAEYTSILTQNISEDHIRTLQQGDNKPTKKSSYIFKPDDDFPEESDNESVHSNYSDDLPLQDSGQEVQEKITCRKEDANIHENNTQDYDDDGTDASCEDSDIDLKEIQSLVKTRRSKQDTKENMDEGAKYEVGHIIGESLGKQFLTNRGRLIIMRPPCDCKLKCFEKISEKQRELIFSHFWRLGKRSEQWKFVVQNSTRTVPKSRSVAVAVKTKPRAATYRYRYFLPVTKDIGDNDAEKVEVCITMFCQTLVISSPTKSWQSFDKYGADMKRKGKRYAWMNDKQEDSNDKETSQEQEISSAEPKPSAELKEQDYTLRAVKNVKNIEDIEFDNTHLDFLYKAMPWEEFMLAMSGKPKQEKRTRKKSKSRHSVSETSGPISTVEKKLQPPCVCRRKCGEKLDEEQRLYLFNYYQELGRVYIGRQWAFAVRFSERLQKLRARVTNDADKFQSRRHRPRQFTFRYYLPVTKDFDGERVRVCKVMFENTLGCQGKHILFAWRRYEKGKLVDRRGKTSSKDISTETRISVKEHLNHVLETDPDLSGFKFRKLGWLKFNMLYKDYVRWLETSTYDSSCKPPRTRYKILLYQALGYERPPNFVCQRKGDKSSSWCMAK